MSSPMPNPTRLKNKASAKIKPELTKRKPLKRLSSLKATKAAPLLLSPITEAQSAQKVLTKTQALFMAACLSIAGLFAFFQTQWALRLASTWLWISFMLISAIRLAASFAPKPIDKPLPTLPARELPHYSAIVALYREDKVAKQLINALSKLNYPKTRLEIIFVLEEDDTDTKKALEAARLKSNMRIMIVPHSHPKTKPKALNYALQFVTSQFVVVYDAEDRPHPDQLLETVQASLYDGDQVICWQSPLNPIEPKSWVGRQFKAEYNVQFGLIFPALSQWKLTFPLGGTSNHFRTEPLRAIGGWDAYNVTEDADLGFRLARLGYVAKMLTLPTYETAPDSLKDWLPQRTRWLKGYMQTLLVQARSLHGLNTRLAISLFLTLGLTILTCLFYAPIMIILASSFMAQAFSGQWIMPVLTDMGLLLFGTFSAVIALNEAVKRYGPPMRLMDLLSAPFYWGLMSLAFMFALYQLLTKPHYWDKTDHSPAS